MNWPQYTYLFFFAMGLGISIVQHGTPKTGKNNFFGSLFGGLVCLALLYYGGFFNEH